MNTEVRSNTAKWNAKRGFWRIRVQREGELKEFTSSIKGTKGKQICNAKADKWLRERTINSNTRIDTLMQQYLEYKEKNVGTSRCRNLQSNAKKWILPFIGTKHIIDIKNYMLQDILDIMYEEGKAYKTINGVKNIITDFFKFARRKEVTKLVPEIEVNKKAKKVKKGSLQPDDIFILFKSDKTIYKKQIITDPYIYAYRFLVMTGLRRGELIALKKENIKQGKIIEYNDKKMLNPKGQVFLHISSSINEYKETTKGKTKNSQRFFALSDKTLKILKQQENMLKKLCIDSEYLFPSSSGNFMRPGDFYYRFKVYAQHNKLSKTTLHELRHTFVSLNKDTIEEKKMLEIVGHGNKATNEIYQHIMLDELSYASNQIDNRLKYALAYGEKMIKD